MSDTSVPPGPRGAAAKADATGLLDEAFLQRLEYLAIMSRRVFAGKHRAERRSRRTGTGIEFADHRHYVLGDDIRYLDWHAYGRLGRLLLRLFEEEEDLSVYLLLDCSASMGHGSPSKLNYAKQLAAALAYIALAHLDRVSIVTFRAGLSTRLPATRGKNRIFRVLDFLHALEPEGRTDLAAAAKTFAVQHRRRGVCVLLSDLYDPHGFETGLNALRYARFEPHVIHISDPQEREVPRLGEVRLVDIETGEARDVTLTPRIRERYTQAYAAFMRALVELCSQKHVPFYSLATHVPFDQAMLHILRRGGMVG